jgi:hypothetical protein
MIALMYSIADQRFIIVTHIRERHFYIMKLRKCAIFGLASQ